MKNEKGKMKKEEGGKREKRKIKEEKEKRKGFVITIDAVLAVIILLFFILTAITVKISEKNYLLDNVGMDIGSVIEKNKDFDINNFLIPDNVCAKVSVYRDSYDEGNLVYESIKYGCGEPSNERYAWRTFYNRSFYIIKITVWYK
ncbi:MAG: hypothetical protein QXI58_06600 [Candidatus Micrarchaeia archaeon]